MGALVKDMTPDPAQIELTILMPCLNEAETIETVVRKAMGYLASSGIVGEVLIADNGSTDGSQGLATALGARVIAVPVRGYGAALIAGIDAALGRYIIMGDADDSYDFTALDPFVEKLRGGNDLVMGNRFKGGIKPGAMPPLHRYLGNPVLSQIGRSFFKIPIGDFHCGLRGFSREAILRLNLSNTGMEFASEMVVKASMRKLAIVEVPTVLSPDGRSRPPHLRTWRDGWRHLRFLLLHSPRWLFLYPGVFFILVGVAALLVLGGGDVMLRAGIGLGVHTLAVACFAVLIGSQLLLFSGVARRYAEIEGFLPEAQSFRWLMQLLTLEWIAPVGAVLLLGGIVGFFAAVMQWASSNFGAITDDNILRVLLISLTSIALGVQTIASGFLASVFEIRHKHETVR
nr:glycosyltransferase family 2 protein [Polymorphobacter sp.]